MRRASTFNTCWIMFLSLWLTFGFSVSTAYAADQLGKGNAPTPIERHVVLLLLDGLRLSDITPENTPNLWKMQEVGSIGVMNLNTLGGRTELNAMLTLGSGSRAGASLGRVEAYRVGERVPQEGQTVTGQDLYVRHTGVMPRAEVVLPQWPQLVASMEKQKYNTFTLGLLGDLVHEVGGKTAVLANSDVGATISRSAAVLASDSTGQVDIGSFQVGRVLDPTRPFGMRTDVDTFFKRYQQIQQEATFVVLEPGDLLRWRHARDLMQEQQEAHTYELALHDGDALLGKLLSKIGPDTMIAVTSPVKYPIADAPALSPVLLAGGSIMAGGLLTSATTKRKGLLANIDLAPTCAAFLRDSSYLPTRDNWVGQPVISQTVMDTKVANFTTLKKQVETMLVPSQARAVLVKPWMNAWIGLVVLMLLTEGFRRAWLRFFAPLAEFLLVFPLAWLYVPLFHPRGNGEMILYSLGLALSLWMMARSIRSPLIRQGTVAGLTALTLFVDLLSGASLLEQSVLSYDPIAGARYYGIGNEYMGVLLGSLFLFLNAWNRAAQSLTVRGRMGVLSVFLAVILLFAAPNLGTNAGGAMAAAVGCTYAWMQFGRWRMRRAHWIGLSVVCACVLVGMFLLNVMWPGAEQTHIGRAAQNLVEGKFAALYQIGMRKLQLNVLLLRVSSWGKLFLLLLLFVLVRVLRRSTSTSVVRRNGRMVLMAALAACLFNDSGVVAAALALLYAAVPLVNAPQKREMELSNWDILAHDTAPQE